MLGKTCINRYSRNRGGSTEERSWYRQRKFGGMEQWHFHIVMEVPRSRWSHSEPAYHVGQSNGHRDRDGFDIVGIQLLRLSHPCSNFCL